MDSAGSCRRSDGFLQFLGGAEGNLLRSLDLNFLAGGGVTAFAGGALENLQNAKTADTDAVALLEVLGHEADQIAEHRFSVLLRHLMGLREIRGEMLQR